MDTYHGSIFVLAFVLHVRVQAALPHLPWQQILGMLVLRRLTLALSMSAEVYTQYQY
jgi:hypothetical protein